LERAGADRRVAEQDRSQGASRAQSVRDGRGGGGARIPARGWIRDPDDAAPPRARGWIRDPSRGRTGPPARAPLDGAQGGRWALATTTFHGDGDRLSHRVGVNLIQ